MGKEIKQSKTSRGIELDIKDRVDDLLSRMTLEEKVRQLSSAKLSDVIADLKNHTFNKELALKNVPHGCGYMSRIGGATDLYPSRMASLMNKIQEYFVEETRLGIPVIFLTEATTGVLSREHTLFPQNIGAGAMFNERLMEEMGDAVRREMTATGERMALAPVIDVVRDHRYGRYEESFAEDVYLVSQYGKAYTRGLQSEDLSNGVAANLKHFVGQGINDGGRNCGPIHATEKEILDEYAVPFAAAIKDAGAASVMAAYHEFAHVPCHASRKILVDILREEIGFEGLLISDGSGIQLLKHFQEYCASEKEAAVAAFEVGIEMELDEMYKKHLQGLIEEGRLSEEVLDLYVSKVLALKFELGLFEDPYVQEDKVQQRVACSEHQEVAGKMARQSITLLKNEGEILPLSGEEKSIAVVGPLADKKEFAYGDYSYPTHFEEVFYKSDELPEKEILARSLFYKKKETKFEDLFHDVATIYETVKEYVAPETKVYHAPGLKDTFNYNEDEDFYMIEEAVQTASQAEVIIAVCGDTSGMGPENDSGESVDRATISLSDCQRELLEELNNLGKPIILVLCNGRPQELSWEADNMDAILEAWKSGQNGAEAICDVLFGEYNPAGRLPVTIPKALGQLPIYYSRRPSGKKQFWRGSYLEVDLDPLYEFGFGLSYTQFTYGDIEIYRGQKSNSSGEAVIVKLQLENTGELAGEEVVQVYVNKKYTSVLQPERELKAYKRVFLQKGEQKELQFEIALASLCYHGPENQQLLEDCQLKVMVGSSSEDIRGQETFQLNFPGGKKLFSERVYSNRVSVSGSE